MLQLHIPKPDPEKNDPDVKPDRPHPEVPEPPGPPDMEPVVPQQDPPSPGHGNDVPGGPPQIIA